MNISIVNTVTKILTMNFDEIYDAPIWVFKNQKIDLLIYLVYLDQAVSWM